MTNCWLHRGTCVHVHAIIHMYVGSTLISLAPLPFHTFDLGKLKQNNDTQTGSASTKILYTLEQIS